MPESNSPLDRSAFGDALDLGSAFDLLPPSTKAAAASLNLRLSPDDGMNYSGDDFHYLTCGASALNVILSAQQLAGAPNPTSILDFGSGAGRVTRWLRAGFPAAHIAACDLRPQDIQFCRDQFGADAWVVEIDIEALAAHGSFDLIWVGSVLTHLSADKSGRLIDKLLSWTKVGGLVILSIIGRSAKNRNDGTGKDFIHSEGWAKITQQYDASGFGYADYSNAAGYGLSLTKLSWAAGLIERLPGARLVALSEGVWDNLHDILAIQKTEAGSDLKDPLRSNATAAVAELFNEAEASRRGSAIEASTLWRATRPIRFAARLFGR